MLKRSHFRSMSIMILCVAFLMMGWGGVLVGASPDQQDDGIELVYGQTVDGDFDGDRPSVFYVFEAQTGDVVTITMIVTEGDLDPFLVLNDIEQNLLATDDNSGGGVNARLTFVIPVAGRYLIQATPAGGIVPEGESSFSLNLTAAMDIGETPVDPVETAEPVASSPVDDLVEQGDSTRLVKLVAGTAVQDTLDRQVAVRFYWFEAAAGDQIAITLEQVAEFQPLMVLYDARFEEQQRALPDIGIRITLAEEGVFFLAVSLPDTGSTGGDYGFTFGQTNQAENIIDLTYGQREQGNLDAAIAAVTYRFQGTAGDTVTITMMRTEGDLNSYLYLTDGLGQLLYEDDDGGENGDAQMRYTLPVDGDYLIVATRLDQELGTTSGSYELELHFDAEASSGAVVEPVLPSDYELFLQLAYGETVEGGLSDAKFMDIYIFLGTAGDAITIEMTSLNGDAVNALDPLLIVLDDARIPLVEHDDIVDSVERDARLEMVLPRTAYYAIVATRFDQGAGDTFGPYSLVLRGPEDVGAAPGYVSAEADVTPLAKLAPMTLNPGTPAQATFDAGAVLYTFTASSGTLVDLSATTDSGLDSVLILVDENMNEIISSGSGMLTGITIPKTGRYLTMLAPRFGPADGLGGGYILALTQSSVAEPVFEEGPRVLVYGDTVNGDISEEELSQLYTFEGKADERVRITMEATPDSALDCYLELQDAEGVLDANDDIEPGIVQDSQLIVDLAVEGTYSIIASRYVGPEAEPTTGTYRLSLELLDENVVVGVSSLTLPLIYGQAETGEINDEQYLLFYVFDGVGGDVVTIEIDNLAGNLDSVLHLYLSAGDEWVELVSNDDALTGGTYEAELRGVVLPQTGKYLIAVGRYGLERENTYGTFMITLTREP